MRLPKVRTSVRGLMIAVALLAPALAFLAWFRRADESARIAARVYLGFAILAGIFVMLHVGIAWSVAVTTAESPPDRPHALPRAAGITPAREAGQAEGSG